MSRRTNLLTRILIAASLVVIAAFSGFALYIDSLQREAVASSVADNIASSGKQAAQSVSNWLSGRLMLTESVARNIEKAGDSDAALKLLQNDVLTAQFTSTYYGDENGAYIHWPKHKLAEGYDPRKRPWYKLAFSTGGAVLTEPYVSASSGQLNVTAAVPVKVNGKTVGIVGSDFSLETLVSAIKAVDAGPEGVVFLVNKNGKILIHPDPSLANKSLQDIFGDTPPPISTLVSEAIMGGKSKLVSFVPIGGALPNTDWDLAFVVDRDNAYASVGKARIVATVATMLCVVAMISLLGTLLSYLVVDPITKLTRTMEELAAGQLDIVIPGLERSDQIGSMASAVAVFRSNAEERLRLQNEAEFIRSNTDRERAERAHMAAQRNAEIVVAVDALADGLKNLSNGNLKYRITTPFVSDLDRLREDFNLSSSKLNDALLNVGDNARAIDAGAIEVRHAADELARRTEQQAASVEQTAAALEEITTTVKTSADRAEQVGKRIERTRTSAESAGHVVRAAVEAMGSIDRSSREIADIVTLIDAIAFQTNLLALNAGVEAARAGDAGKGFAVVAQEVRDLAQRSASAAEDINKLVNSAGYHVREGVALVGETGEALALIVTEVQEISNHMTAIVRASKEQSAGLNEIHLAVNTIDHGTQQNAAMVEEQTAASHTLASEATALKSMLAQFKLSTTNVETGRRLVA